MKKVSAKQSVLPEKSIELTPAIKDHEGLTITIASLKTLGYKDASKEIFELRTMIENLKK